MVATFRSDLSYFCVTCVRLSTLLPHFIMLLVTAQALLGANGLSIAMATMNEIATAISRIDFTTRFN